MIPRLILLPLLLLLLIGVSVTAQTDSAAMATTVFAAIRTADWKELRSLLPPAKMVRAMSAKQAKKLKDKQVINLIEKRVRDGFNQILASAKEKGIELQALEFARFQTMRPWEGADRPIALEIFYRWQGREGSIAFSVIEYQGRWYLLEILRSVNIFDKVAPQ